MGIGIGISGFAGIIQNAQGFQEIKTHLPEVTDALGTAFDTTLLALGLSAVAVFSMSELLKRQERLLEQLDNLCFDEVCSLFKEHSTSTVEIVEAIGSNVEEIVVRSNGNRAQLEDVIRRELPELIGERVAPLAATLAGRLDQYARVTSDLAATQAQSHRDAAGQIEELTRAVRALAAAQEKSAERFAAELRELQAALRTAAARTGVREGLP
jgi:ABC-type transporter Mla subunit MlaD